MAVDEAACPDDHNPAAAAFKHLAEKFKTVDGKFMERFPSAMQKEGVEKEFGQSGLKKLLVRAGQGWDVPKPGDELTVHYVGRFADGTKFDSTHDKNQPFVFRLGQGEVIRGWDRGIGSMKKKEVAVFTIPPDMAYGKAGCPPLVPPNATLVFEVELLTWASITDVLKDGGIVKKVVSEGHKWETPKDSDEVTVRFTATLQDGTLVEKTPAKGVTICPRDGFFCPAIGKAVRAMKHGEQALLTVTPQYGFAEQGRKATRSGAYVPPYATLTVDIELLEWRTVDDVTDDRRVVKKILVAGEGQTKPNDGALVRVKYEARLLDGTVFERKGYGQDDLLEFTIGEEQAVSGLDRAVAAMKKGEVAEVTIAPDYGYGGSEFRTDLATVPPSSTLVYIVELVSFDKDKDIWEMSTLEKLEAASKHKEEGNQHFKGGKYWRASKKYDKAVKYIDHDHKFSDEEKKLSKQLKTVCCVNNAASKLKQEKYKDCIALCTKVLDLEAGNMKALYRRAQAYLENADIELADKDVRKMIAADPHNRDAKVLQQELRKRGLDYDKKAAKLFGTMVARLNSESS
ncbi:hypothetical protein SELMODRAFT_445274 [Selaginella moellendorffii]|uniref:peptidylprolyl isomerase n=1 Tax=Selaginella moellendorffii TaxID=88036 RepID=D8SHB0_SELML|nr:peptidyl-prolyl cis-trans isomerase FKBP62 [Selaginella moellendorffii]EFJ16354.1 hypothetical protein SELMODRAFT_445274 [Selaginella moellendorffii]|eukprot:XP_002982601.1 peptidyl-prolyl cis-trans isomerase FKBP62 [Selaginella moellendorffii]